MHWTLGQLRFLTTSFDRSGGEYWFERDGETYHKRKIGGFDSSPLNYEVADLDGDGDTDLIGLSWRAEKWTLSWGENVGGEFATEHVLTGQFDDRTLKVYPIDVDEDGDFDIVVEPRPGLLRWYDNDGAGGVSGPKLPAARLAWIARLMYADGNGDGQIDQIIADAGNAISWDQPLQSKFALNFHCCVIRF